MRRPLWIVVVAAVATALVSAAPGHTQINQLLPLAGAAQPQDNELLLANNRLPDMMRLDEMTAAYAAASGHQPRDMEFHTLYAALRHAIVMFRIGRRQVHFGEIQMPEDPDAMIPHRDAVEAMMEGSYWDTRR